MTRYQTALILGYGRSGRAAERLLKREGAETTVLAREKEDPPEVELLLQKKSFEVCVVSPGFALNHPWVQAIREAGIPLISELELGWSRHPGKTVAVTGSNGKSTAVKWIYESLCSSGRRAAIGGNYGIPVCEVVLEHSDLDWLVLEVSSFQLETADQFAPDIAVLLNILPNHLDRHGDMDAYWMMKTRIFGPEGSAAVCVVPEAWQSRFAAAVAGDRTWITFGDTDSADFHFENGAVLHHGVESLNLSGTLFDTPVLGGCTGAAVAAALTAADVSMDAVASVAREFVPLPHRMQKLGELGGVVYINDSKATNLAALAAAVQGCRAPVHLIAGGLAKESDYTFVKEVLAERVLRIYLIGKASRSMYQAWKTVCSCVECVTLECAFKSAQEAARSGDIVLLSPGCASFDQFGSFEERGDRFSELFHLAEQSCGAM